MTDAGAERSIRGAALAALLGLVVPTLLCAPSGADYLAYYLPAARYVAEGTPFPPRLLPSVSDGPFAYPPAEYVLLAPAFLVPAVGGLWVRLVAAAKLATLVGLLAALARRVPRPELVFLYLLVPTALRFDLIQSTDLQPVLATAALLLWREREEDLDAVGWLALGLVTYADLSKFTFLPLHALAIALFALERPRRAALLLAPLLALVPVLAKNALLYADPVFPVAADRFGVRTPGEVALYKQWVVPKAPPLRLLSEVTGTLVPLAAALRSRQPVAVAFGAYAAVWLGWMAIDEGGNAARFLLPLSLVTLHGLARADVGGRALAAAGVGLLGVAAAATPSATLAAATAPLALAWPLATLAPSWTRRALPWVMALGVGGYGAAKVIAKPSLDPADRGEAALHADVARIVALREGGLRVVASVQFGHRELAEGGVGLIGSALGGEARLGVGCDADVVVLRARDVGWLGPQAEACGLVASTPWSLPAMGPHVVLRRAAP